MDQKAALDVITALSHETRLTAFRLLVVAGPEGLPAGAISERLGVLSNTLSTHLGLLVRSGLVRSCREGRSIRYSADFGSMRSLMEFLVRDCCAGRPEICSPLAAIAESCGACVAGETCA